MTDRGLDIGRIPGVLQNTLLKGTRASFWAGGLVWSKRASHLP